MTSEERLRRMLERHDLHVRVFDAGSELVAPIEADALRDVLARLKAAEADARRLDWMQANQADADWDSDRDNVVVFDGIKFHSSPNLRAAIDAAMGETVDTPKKT
jgi:hypothetical protein